MTPRSWPTYTWKSTGEPYRPDAFKLSELLVVFVGAAGIVGGFCAALKLFGVWPW